ncbi:glycosyltransferase [filamentous cyanobacterium LEGE 11480]|uniref:Glycosyltransferase n=1 Tax=Romeriopsis navalis LEGE 11480 TaxID=2777977 RepID=A0A928Z2P6_9CYAN|nr:glycosyltransferase family 2 protein [Romeriopsis navalis]MBE9030601.1 glycosyltransferase [Romeriopsis navalis LEGE 11480]
MEALMTQRKDRYLNFLKQLNLPTKIQRILEVRFPAESSLCLCGAVELIQISALDLDGEIYEFDVRYASDNKIFQQNLIDQAWDRLPLIDQSEVSSVEQHKIIIYLCEPETQLLENLELDSSMPVSSLLKLLPERYILGSYWRSVHHLYVALPCMHPFEIDTPYLTCQSSTLNIKTPPPLVTVVTVVYNGELLIEQTIQSVINQTYPNIEYIVVDGDSTDRTLEIISKYEKYISKWISEPDSGLYDAMNKGFELAQGDFVNFMNVGDMFANNLVLDSMDFQDSEVSICGANIFFSRQFPRLLYSKPRNQHIPHQAFFMHRRDFRLHRFDITFPYSADSELWRRYKPWCSAKFVPGKTISLSRFGGISTNPKYLLPRMFEHLAFEDNPVKVLARFIPKLLASPFLTESMIESLYFQIYGCKSQ